MSFIEQIDVLVLTFNEEANLARTLDALAAFPRVVVLDSGSTDATLAIAARYPNVRVRTRAFDTHANQWNHGLHHCGLESAWVLALDADYLLTNEAVAGMAQLSPDAGTTGYRARFRYCIDGKPLTGSLYPPVTVLYRRAGAHYMQDGHTQRIVTPGRIRDLPGEIRHDDRKPFSAWLQAQERYAQLECDLLLARAWSSLRWRDRLRRLVVVTPWLVPLYCLTARLGILDGRAGLFYALQRSIAEAILSAKLLQAHWARTTAR